MVVQHTMNVRNILWWLFFFVVGIWGQYFLPGVDLLMVGLVISLQEGRVAQTLWLFICLTFIQEGIGTVSFGSSLLWYAMLFVLYFIGRWLFQARNVFFMILLGGIMGLWHYVLVIIMATLQEYKVPHDTLFFESMVQALIFPVFWIVMNELRIKRDTDVISV